MAGEDPAHISIVHRLPCVGRSFGRCRGEVEAHHHRDMTGLAIRPHDHDAVPLCGACHDAVHDGHGPFDGWTKEARRAWFWERVAETRERVARARRGMELCCF